MTSRDVSALAIDPSFPSVVYAGSSRAAGGPGGVFKSINGGLNWTAVNAGLVESGACTAGPTALCLNGGRFRVQVNWRAPSGARGDGQAVALTPDTGVFWFFNDSNIELAVKVLDGRSLNGRFWVFFGALSNVEYTVAVTDTQTGLARTYFNAQGQLASVADTAAF